MQQFNNLSSWREDNFTVKGGEVFEVDFLDTKPNIFVLQNSNDVSLKCSISRVPTSNNYEYTVNKNSSQTFGRPTQTSKLYVLNEGGTDADIKLFSIFMTFDANLLKNTLIQLDGATVQTDGIVRGWASGVKIPSGDNTIGKVELGTTAQADLSKLSDIKTTIDSIEDSVSHLINNTDTTGLTNLFKVWGEIYGIRTLVNDVRSMLYLDNKRTYIQAEEFQDNVQSFSYTCISNDSILKFDYLFNDSDNHVILKRNRGGVNVDLLTILSGEQLGELEIPMNNGDIITITGTNPLLRIHYKVVK